MTAWLGLSGVTTTLSTAWMQEVEQCREQLPTWIFYYKVLKIGDVATVALIDKSSVVVTILLAWLLLKEVITLCIVLGAALIVAGLLVIVKKP